MRRLGLFALVFIVLAALYWLLEAPGSKPGARQDAPLLAAFTPGDIARIAITCPRNGAVELTRTETGWQVTVPGTESSYAADAASVQKLLDQIATLTAGTKVSRNPGRHALYEVSADTGLRVQAFDGNGTSAAAVLIGKSGPNIFSTYVRAADNDNVYLVDGILQGAASKTLNEWRDKSLFSFDPQNVQTYNVTGDCTLALSKNEDDWFAGPDNTPVDTDAVAKLMQSFAAISAADFADGALEDFGFARPSRIITVELEDETRVSLLSGSDANAFQQHAKRSGADTVYIIEKYQLDGLCPTIEELTTPEPDQEEPPDKIDTATNS